MRIVVKALAILLFVVGALIVFLAGKIENKYQLGNKETIKGSENFEEKDVDSLKVQKAVIRVKLYGLIFLAPGLVGILIMFD
ncbi:MAG TPA: hypothetical protein DDZ89_20200 [Clostridiales bacterium]|nr:hypothetical protein [Clostridiales bacterium]